jgi:hypothetical protein
VQLALSGMGLRFGAGPDSPNLYQGLVGASALTKAGLLAALSMWSVAGLNAVTPWLAALDVIPLRRERARADLGDDDDPELERFVSGAYPKHGGQS